jgi:hypothetical protein
MKFFKYFKGQIQLVLYFVFVLKKAIGEFDLLDPYVARAGFAPASEVAGGHTLPF